MTATPRAKPSSVGQWQRLGRVIALITDRTDAARIVSALRPMPVIVVAALEQLWTEYDRAGHSCAGFLLEARDSYGESTTPFISALAQHGDRIPVLGYVGAGAVHADALRELARAGVHELVFREADDSAAFLAVKFARGEETRAAADVLRRIQAHTPRRLLPIADYALNFPRDKHSVARVAAGLGINRKTLANWCAREKWPPPGIIITWCRLLLAAELLQIPGRTVERTVNALDFASASSFRNLCQRYLRRRPSTLAAPGALDQAYDAFVSYTMKSTGGAPALAPEAAAG